MEGGGTVNQISEGERSVKGERVIQPCMASYHPRHLSKTMVAGDTGHKESQRAVRT